jgi:hypothetical protein
MKTKFETDAGLQTPTVEDSIRQLTASLVESKGWMTTQADAIIRDAIDRVDTDPKHIMVPMNFEGGRVGYYLNTPEFYCDIEPDKNGVWSVFFRDMKTGSEGYGVNPDKTPQYEAEISRLNVRVTELEAANKILETEEANIILKYRKQLSSLCDENDTLAQEADMLYRSKVYSGD